MRKLVIKSFFVMALLNCAINATSTELFDSYGKRSYVPHPKYQPLEFNSGWGKATSYHDEYPTYLAKGAKYTVKKGISVMRTKYRGDYYIVLKNGSTIKGRNGLAIRYYSIDDAISSAESL